MTYAALFRGINVGGKNIVRMAELKKLFAGLGFTNVQTYIQSGNVVFDADEAPHAAQTKIAEAFADAFGFESAVTLRTKDELIALMENLPFSPADIAMAEAANPDVEHLYVYLLEVSPPQEDIQRLNTSCTGADKLCAGDRAIYLLCHQSIRDSKLAASLAKLKTPMTARNWKTLGKLRGMLEG